MRVCLPPVLQPRSRKPLAVTAAFNELPLQPLDLPVEQIVRLVDQADQRVSNHRRVVVVKPLRVGFF